MNLTECLPHPQSEKSFNAEEAIEELRRKLKAAFPFFLNDLLVRSSWEIVKLYPVKGLTGRSGNNAPQHSLSTRT